MVIIATRRHLGADYLGRLGRTLGLPIVIAFIPLLGAQYISAALQASPLLAFCLASAGSLCAVSIFVILRYIRSAPADVAEQTNDIFRDL